MQRIIILILFGSFLTPGPVSTTELIEKKVSSDTHGLRSTKPASKYSEEELSYITGYLYESRGELEKAMEFYKKSLAINKNFLPAKTNLAIILFEKEKFQEAIKYFFEMYQDNPNSKLAINNYALALLFKDHRDLAINIFQEGLRKFPKDYDLRFNLGTAFYKNSMYHSAKKTYLGIFQFRNNDYAAWNNLGCTQIALQEYSEAVNTLKKAMNAKPGYSQAYYNLAYTYWKMGHNDKARQKINQVLSMNPNHRLAIALLKNLEQP